MSERASESAESVISRLSATVSDYPKPGIVFRDLTPVFADGPALRTIVHALIDPFEGQFDAVAGIEARGFLLAAAGAYASGKGVVTVRKKGKLPRKVYSEDYTLEYGSATLELHADDLKPGMRVLILDDVLATGGTLGAACRLFERAGVQVSGFGVVLELTGLRGRAALAGHRIRSLVRE
ncbi:adenine phosphoribosyltransferase [Arthrobacter crystallopoietes]|uniref:adenine phosphoribosyltransferase n=1 Tax=Crystallibacter crystallopoietes TaxID=37928 RepID=UPI0011112C98|nr:adenine phosphoribosyltransferase [Arthrobacter crystallopoietes]QTG79864.1 adenine phosphoribosyltransferase [Arthrobacter crystallopoietes]